MKIKSTLFYIGTLCIIFMSNAQTQTLKYTDAVLMLSKENINGTARFNAMSGAFGALGGNLSSAEVNPAGLTVFRDSQSALSLNNHYFSTETDFYGNTNESDENNFNLNHAGAVIVFENNNDYWNKFSLAFNYNLKNDFENNIIVNGNSGVSEFTNDPFLNSNNDITDDIFYTNTETQRINSLTQGSNGKASFSFAAKYDKKTSIGVSLITQQLDYEQLVIFNEFSNDGNNNTINAQSNQQLFMEGDGIGFNIGILHKASKNVRLGLAYQSPIWYDITEEYFEDNLFVISNNSRDFRESLNPTFFEYNIKTPSTYTASFAYIFNEKGLISMDYSHRDYKNAKIKPTSEFNDENNYISNHFNNTNSLKVGAEYRLEKLNLRAGYNYNENPNKNIKENNYGFSFGLGFKIGEYTTLDFAYQKQKNYYNYSYFNDDTFSNNKVNNSNITTTLTVGL